MDLSTILPIIAVVVAILGYKGLQRYRSALFELRIQADVRRAITDDGYEIVLRSRSEYDVFLKKVTIIIMGRQKYFKIIRAVTLHPNEQKIIPLVRNPKTGADNLVHVRPTETLNCRIKIKTKSRYWGRRSLTIANKQGE